MILGIVRVRLQPDITEESIRTIRGFLEPTRVEPGCLNMRCGRDVEDESVLMIEEGWASREDWQRHVRSEGYKVTLHILDSVLETPEVKYYEVTITGGIEELLSICGNLALTNL